MKDKKNLILLIVAIILFIISLVFAVSIKIYYSAPKVENEKELDAQENNIIQDDSNTNEEVSETKDLEVTYSEFSAYTKEEKEIKLSNYKDTAVMILFWNSENEDAVEMLKRINEIYPNYKESVNVLAINTKNETKLDILNEVEVPIYYDKNEAIVKQFNITEFPAMIYINSQNEVFNAKTGLTTKDALQANFDILAENF